jgi:mono/diheme cytochrome c family protein
VTGYSFVLFCHSTLRWAVVLAGAVALARSAQGFFTRRAATPGDERAQRAFVGLFDLQFLLGLALYFFYSPIVDAFWDAPRAAMKEHTVRFFGIEHIMMMLIASAVLHAGRTRAKKATLDRARHRSFMLASFFSLALIGAAIPWPGLRHGRPLARGPSDAPAPVATPGACPEAYAARCAVCHGARGAGDGLAASALEPPPRSFRTRGWDAGKSDAELASVVREGGARHGLSAAMPSHSDLADGDITALVHCVRTFQSR